MIIRRARFFGFTFVETMVVIALFSIVSVGLFQSFSSGLKIWRRVTDANSAYREYLPGLERLSREVRQMQIYPGAEVFGNQEQLRFVNVLGDDILQISYVYSSSTMALERTQSSLIAQAREPFPKTITRPAMTAVKRARFWFYGLDQTSGNYTFWETWNSTNLGLPQAVRLELELEGARFVDKIIPLPSAQ